MNPISLLIVLGCVVTLLCPAPSQAAAAPQASPYLGASGCKDCHGAIYDAWDKTKHAGAFQRLSSSDRESGTCITCHVTGSPEQVAREDGQPSLPGVQCEACHGPARTHATAAATNPPATAGLIRRADAKLCQGCHNPSSPHYKGFLYTAMVGFVHRAQ